METIKFKRSDPEIKQLVEKTFPDYIGRKIQLRQTNKYHMQDYWSGGTRHYAIAYNLATGETMPTPNIATNPFNKETHQTIDIPDGFAIIEHSYFCGKDLGITINVNSNTFPKMLPANK